MIEDVKQLNGIQMLNYSGTCYEIPSQMRFAYQNYWEPSEWWYLSNTTEKIFDPTDPLNLRCVTNVIDFEYNNNHKQVIKTTNHDSKGNEIITYTKYPLDETTLADPIMWNESLSNYKHIHNAPVKVETFNGSNRIAGTINNYTYDEVNKVVNLSSVSQAQIGGDYEQRINFTKYDAVGNVIEMKKINDTPIAIIWGYNKTLPIAKITNATYAQVEVAISSSDLLALNGNSLTAAQIKQKLAVLYTALPAAHVSLYIHDPLAGILSTSDENNAETKYVYDDLKRLLRILDRDLQPVVEYKYQYKQN
jgi:YD repeat-containing protein